MCVCGESLVLDVNKSWRKLEIHSVCAETFCIYLIQLRLRRAENFRKALFCYLDSFFGRLIIFLLVLCRKLVLKRKTCSFNLHRIASQSLSLRIYVSIYICLYLCACAMYSYERFFESVCVDIFIQIFSYSLLVSIADAVAVAFMQILSISFVFRIPIGTLSFECYHLSPSASVTLTYLAPLILFLMYTRRMLSVHIHF